MAVQLGSRAVGDIINIKENGLKQQYIIVNQGRPSSMYDSSCDGTWLLRRKVDAAHRGWAGNNENDYSASNSKVYLNSSTFLDRFEADIKNLIKQVKIPYRPGSGTSSTVNTGGNGLSVKAFSLSAYEVGLTNSDYQYLPQDGYKLSYFTAGTSSSANNKRVTDWGGQATDWWLRTPHIRNSNEALLIKSDGSYGYKECSVTGGIRPAFILPSTLVIDDEGNVIVNTAPTTPGSILLPTTIKGGESFTISWGASSDAENNLQGYYLQRSINSGSTWAQIYQGSARSTTDRLTFGLTDTVIYRVKAYDSDGAESGWRISISKIVINNNVPTAPSAINVPAKINSDNNIIITWSASSDADSNLSGYKLERKVDSEAWVQIFTGDALSYTDFITKGWENVTYRVKAYDSLGDESGYTTSPTRQVNNNTAPSISGSDEDLGLKAESFSLPYTVSDVDEGQIISVIEEIDGIKKREYEAVLGQENALIITETEWQKVLNGQHTIKIIASDSEGASTVRTYTFIKNETEIELTLKTPLPTDDMVTKAIMNITRQIPLGASFTVEVCNNGNDAEPSWEDITNSVINGSKFFFTNTAKTADNWGFNFHIKISRNDAVGDCFISSVGGNFE